MNIGKAYQEYSAKYFSVVYAVTDAKAFTEERKRIIDEKVSGGNIVAMCLGNYAAWADYADYLLDYIDAGIRRDYDPPLTYAEWLENNCPKKHVQNKEYIYLEK